MENDGHIMAICLSSYQCHVCHNFSLDKRLATVIKDLALYNNTCSLNGDLHTGVA
jgi:hypothetical protein